MIEIIKDIIFTIFHPKYWIMNNPYNQKWDSAILEAMRGKRFKLDKSYTARIGSVVVWVSNHPYASFTPYYPSKLDCRPSRRTIKKCYDRLVEDTFYETLG